jgi:hypothetical protein
MVPRAGIPSRRQACPESGPGAAGSSWSTRRLNDMDPAPGLSRLRCLREPRQRGVSAVIARACPDCVLRRDGMALEKQGILFRYVLPAGRKICRLSRRTRGDQSRRSRCATAARRSHGPDRWPVAGTARRGLVPVHDRGRVVADAAVLIADGGWVLSDLVTLRDQVEPFSPVASDPTLWRVLNEIGAPRPAAAQRHCLHFTGGSARLQVQTLASRCRDVDDRLVEKKSER